VIVAEMRMAVEKGRSTRPDLKVGDLRRARRRSGLRFNACETIGLKLRLLLAVRVPVARLAAAQAVLVKRDENDK